MAGPPQPAPPYVSQATVSPTVHARPAADAAVISRGLGRAVSSGKISRAEASEHRATVRRARATLGRLRGARHAVLARVLNQVRWFAGSYNRPRALTLFSMLDENTRYLARRGLPANETDVRGKGGVIYRVGWGYGLQFHPLGNTIELNRKLTFGTRQAALDHASALAARLVPKSRGAEWEYYFPYGGGSPPWSSGMAQAVGAQALARAGRRLTAPDFFASAKRAYGSIPGRLVRDVGPGPWIKLYSFSRLVVLNANLQGVLSIRNFGETVHDPAAQRLADRLQASARALLPSFDTGFWSKYSLGNESPLEYHLYHVNLLQRLTETPGDFWAQAHARFDRYSREAPKFRTAGAGPKLYPWPAEGWRDSARLVFWVSKISSAAVRVAGKSFPVRVPHKGWYAVVWHPGRRPAGMVRPVVSAVDLAGNRGSAPLSPIEIAVDRQAPAINARVEGRRVIWRAVDEGTPWLRLTLVFQREGVTKTQKLGRRPLSGRARMAVPRGYWQVALVARDSSGNRSRVALGRVPPR